MKIPIQDAIEILNMEGYNFPETDKEIYIDMPEEFTIEELYDVVKDIIPKPKEAWEMTSEEYKEHHKKLYEKLGNEAYVNSGFYRYSSEVPYEWHQDAIRKYPNNTLTQNHYKSIKRALKEGKPVPSKVLKDYPDIIATQNKTFNVGDWIRWEGDYGNVIEGQIEFINTTSSGFRYEIRTRDGETYSVYNYKGKITKI